MNHYFIIDSLYKEKIYHHTAILIYIKACRDVLGDVNVRVGNSLNQGFFTYIETDGSINESTVRKISDRMKSLIDSDIPINIEKTSVEEAIKLWNASSLSEKSRLLSIRKSDDVIDICELQGYKNYFYSDMLPSTGYIQTYELRKYKQGILLRLPNAISPDAIPEYRDDDKLYDAYADSKRMRRATGLDYLADLNEKIREGITDDVIRMSEDQHAYQFREMAETIMRERKKIVLIAGPSSSGKTTTTKRLCKAIGEMGIEPIYLGTDDYFRERVETPIGEDGKPDYESLEALELELFNRDMFNLLNGDEIDVPEFDFITGRKTFGKRIIRAQKGQIIMIEGIHSLNDALTSNIDPKDKFKIYISPLTQFGIDRHNRLSTTDARKLRRMVRDNRTRGMNAETTLENWHKVRAGENENVFPYSSQADIVFNSSTTYETNLLKTYVEPLLQNIRRESPQYEEAKRILEFLNYFEPITSSDAVPEDSILREFIGNK